MPDYEAMYYELFHAVTDAMEALKKAQQKAEELYVLTSRPLRILPEPEREKPPADLIGAAREP